jgi:cytochrome c peroxidase
MDMKQNAGMIVTGLVVGLAACGGETGLLVEPSGAATGLSMVLGIDLDNPPDYENPAYPAHYDVAVRAADNAPPDNPVTNEGATLGRVLFYDRDLSLNRTTSCASCHIQALGFTDPARFSVGFDGRPTSKHSMRLANATFFEGETMFWDHRSSDLEDQVLQPVTDDVEMGFDAEAGGLPALIARLENTHHYPRLFEWAFGSPEVTERGLRDALAQFVRSIVSADSRFDRALAASGGRRVPGPIQGLAGLDAQENLGLRLFTTGGPGGAGCDRCHRLPTFALDEDSRSNGLDAGERVVFKSPSLKNVAVSGPYMHDGRFETLEDVIDHYDDGVQEGPALDRRLRGPDGEPLRLGLTPEEKAALVAFLRTLTDEELLTDARFTDPFDR